MKSLRLYQVYDNVGQVAITGIIPAQNDLTALIGFKNAYIDNKDKQSNPYFYQALDLFLVDCLAQDDDGMLFTGDKGRLTEPMLVCNGDKVLQRISDELSQYGITDKVLDDNYKEVE